jgi:hypothetical protein
MSRPTRRGNGKKKGEQFRDHNALTKGRDTTFVDFTVTPPHAEDSVLRSME